MKFQHTTIIQSLALSTPKNTPKRRKGLSEQVIQERFIEALNNHYYVYNGRVQGQHNKVLTTKINNKLAITFRMLGENNELKQVHIYQEDFIRLWNEKKAKEVKPTKPRYTAQQVAEYLALQETKQLTKVFIEEKPIQIKEVNEIKPILDKFIIGKKTIKTALNPKTPVPDNWNELKQPEQDEYLKYYIKSLLNKNKSQVYC